jgi:GNAT superfamily N-acetyltransferase
MIGAFRGGSLVGVGVITPGIRPGMAQLAYLHVTQPYRRKGVASSIARTLIGVARDLGSRRIYVSATPSQSAVGFYRSLGFQPAAEPLPELFALEPEDIHMILDLTKQEGA